MMKFKKGVLFVVLHTFGRKLDCVGQRPNASWLIEEGPGFGTWRNGDITRVMQDAKRFKSFSEARDAIRRTVHYNRAKTVRWFILPVYEAMYQDRVNSPSGLRTEFQLTFHGAVEVFPLRWKRWIGVRRGGKHARTQHPREDDDGPVVHLLSRCRWLRSEATKGTATGIQGWNCGGGETALDRDLSEESQRGVRGPRVGP